MCGLNTVAVDSQGRICCVLGFYARIQVYSRDGAFLKGWFTGGSGWHSIEIDSDDHLRVYTGEGNVRYTYDLDGRLLAKDQLVGNDKNMAFVKRIEAEDPAGSVCKVRGEYFLPRVVRVSPDGVETIAVSDPLCLRAFSGLLGPVIWISIGAIIKSFTCRLQRERRTHK